MSMHILIFEIALKRQLAKVHCWEEKHSGKTEMLATKLKSVAGEISETKGPGVPGLCI